MKYHSCPIESLSVFNLVAELDSLSYFPHVLCYWLPWYQIAIFPEDPPALLASPLTQQQGRQHYIRSNTHPLTKHFPFTVCDLNYQVNRSCWTDRRVD